MDTLKLFRQRLKALILEQYPSLDRFYLETGFSKGQLSHILRGTRNPSILTLSKLAILLGVEVKDFFVFPEENKRHQAIAMITQCSEETLSAVLKPLTTETRKIGRKRRRATG